MYIMFSGSLTELTTDPLFALQPWKISGHTLKLGIQLQKVVYQDRIKPPCAPTLESHHFFHLTRYDLQLTPPPPPAPLLSPFPLR